MKGDRRAQHQHSQAHAWTGIPDARACEGAGTPDKHRHRAPRTVMSHPGPVRSSRRWKEDEDSPNKLYVIGYQWSCHHLQKSTVSVDES